MRVRSRTARRKKRHLRVRRKIEGTAERPRMAVFVSNRFVTVQMVDDEAGKTLVAATTRGVENAKNVGAARALGQRAAELALQQNIRNVVVDRGGFKFHGRLKAVVDAAVEAGMNIRRDGGAGKEESEAEERSA